MLSLSRYRAVSFKDARGKRDDAGGLLAKGAYSSEARKTEKAKGKLKAGNTFEAIARDRLEHRKAG